MRGCRPPAAGGRAGRHRAGSTRWQPACRWRTLPCDLGSVLGHLQRHRQRHTSFRCAWMGGVPWCRSGLGMRQGRRPPLCHSRGSLTLACAQEWMTWFMSMYRQLTRGLREVARGRGGGVSVAMLGRRAATLLKQPQHGGWARAALAKPVGGAAGRPCAVMPAVSHRALPAILLRGDIRHAADMRVAPTQECKQPGDPHGGCASAGATRGGAPDRSCTARESISQTRPALSRPACAASLRRQRAPAAAPQAARDPRVSGGSSSKSRARHCVH